MPNTFEKHPKLTSVMLILAGLVALLLLDRVLAGIFLKNAIRIKDPYFHHTLSANSFDFHTWGYTTYPMFTNSLGFKDKENRKIELTTSKYRIVFIGDSFVEGLGYPYEKTFVGIIDNTLDRSKYEVLNAGVMSYSPKLYYLKMKKLIEDTGLKMNELVCFIDISDVQDEIVYDDFLPVNRFLYKHQLENYILKKSLIGNKAIALGEKLSARTKRNGENKGDVKEKIGFDPKHPDETYYRERAQWTDNDGVWRRWGMKGMASCEQYMDKLHLLMSRNRIKMTIAVFPWPYQIARKDRDSRQVKFWRKFAEDRNIEFIDYFPLFIQSSSSEDIIKKYYIPGDSHWSEEGNKLVAKVYIDFFLRDKSGR